MSCAQQPCSAPADSHLCLLYCVTPSHIYSFSFPAAFYFSPASQSFQRRLHNVQACFRLSLSEDMLVFLVVQGKQSALPQHHGSNESFFFLISLLYCPTFTSIHSYWDNQVVYSQVVLFHMLSKLSLKNNLADMIVICCPTRPHWLRVASVVLIHRLAFKYFLFITSVPPPAPGMHCCTTFIFIDCISPIYLSFCSLFQPLEF